MELKTKNKLQDIKIDQSSGHKSDSNTDYYNAVKSQETNRRSRVWNLRRDCILGQFEQKKDQISTLYNVKIEHTFRENVSYPCRRWFIIGSLIGRCRSSSNFRLLRSCSLFFSCGVTFDNWPFDEDNLRWMLHPICADGLDESGSITTWTIYNKVV